MKVLHVITGLNDGGAEGVLTRLCLNSKSVSHVVISLMDEGKYGPILTASNIKVHSLGMRRGIPSLSLFLKLIRLIRAEAPDVVQTWMYHADLIGGIAAKVAGVKRIYWGIRHSVLEAGASKRSTIYIARLCAFLSKWLPYKIVCCAEKALSVHADMGYQREKLIVIPNGYDLSRFKPDATLRADIRNEWGATDTDFVIGKVGRFDALKDHSNLLTALSIVKAKGFDFRCILVGKGMDSENRIIVKLIETLDLVSLVLLFGQSSEIPKVMNGLDLHVLSSRSEGFPNVVAEAMACGTPCVSTNVGDAAEIIGSAGAICEHSDPQKLADVICRMINEKNLNTGEWELRKVKSCRHITDNYSLEAMVREYEKAWSI